MEKEEKTASFDSQLEEFRRNEGGKILEIVRGFQEKSVISNNSFIFIQRINVLVIILMLLSLFVVNATEIGNKFRGIIVDEQNLPIESAFVRIVGTNQIVYTNNKGEFKFDKIDKPTVLLEIKALGFKSIQVVCKSETRQTIQMKSNLKDLPSIMVTNDKYALLKNYGAQKVTLSSFEVYTSPTAFGDIVRALSLSPGAQSPDDDGRLYIRGGNPEETKIYVNEMIIYNPYTLKQRNIPQRSRFSPDLYEGIALQSGGYEVNYGQALSGILSMKTKKKMETKTNIDITSVGVSIGKTTNKNATQQMYWEIDYTNLTPYGSIFSDDYTRHEYYNSLKGDFFYNLKLQEKVNMKTYVSLNKSSVDYSYSNVDLINLRNNLSEKYFLGQTTLEVKLNRNLELFFGFNYIYDSFMGTDVLLSSDEVKTNVNFNHNKAYLKYKFNKFNLTSGFETLNTKFKEDYSYKQNFTTSFDDWLIANFYNLEYNLNPTISLSLGIRGEYGILLGKYNLAPRFYVAKSLNKNNIISFSWGIYYQTPQNDFLKFSSNLGFEKSEGVNISYVYAIKRTKLQIDAYYKRYNNLVTYDSIQSNVPFLLNNKGEGYVYGLDAFYKSNFKYLDYTISYSFTNPKKRYLNSRNYISPQYLSAHTLRLDLKYWLRSLKSLVSLSYNISSGTYSYFKNFSFSKKSPTRSSINLNLSYVSPKNWIIHFAVQNILGKENISGYEYSTRYDDLFPRQTPTTRFFYVGFFITIN